MRMRAGSMSINRCQRSVSRTRTLWSGKRHGPSRP